MDEAPNQQNELDKYGLTANEINYTIIDPQNGSQLYNLPQEILLLIAISFMEHPDDAIPFMLVCRSFFLLTKQYDLKIYGNLGANVGPNHTLIEIDNNANTRKELVTEFNNFLHALFSSTGVTPEERNKIIREIANAIVTRKPIDFMSKINIEAFDETNRFIELYNNNMMRSSFNHNAFNCTILDLVETIRRVTIYYHPMTPLRLHSIFHSLSDTNENRLALRMTNDGEITYSKGFELPHGGVAFQSISYLWAAGTMPGIITAGTLLSPGIISAPDIYEFAHKIYEFVQDWFKTKNLSDKLQEKSAVQGLRRYGTFAGQKEKSPVINVEDISDEESNDETAEEENHPRCGASCTLF